ncbi:TPA: 1-deoxy-D-xylulose-5-phosphate reductoisomerase [Candidatus Poribacteria bacterium]|nr:1-deoxy-D-xylulose-5-phosphate reductoisomerase [Candidatus Poribacteria bacterium]
MKRIAVLGSTGSIGRSTLQVIKSLPDELKVIGLAARGSVERIVEQAIRFQVKAIALADEEAAQKASQMLNETDIKVFGGKEGVLRIATMDEADMVVSSMVGISGLLPTLEAIRSGKDIAFANKEVLVAGGEIVMREVERHGVNFLPVDSEISAIFQCLGGGSKDEVKRLILTASGGPFKGFSPHELEGVTVSQALRHPNWRMGSKVTIDSATLMNKGFEVIESMWLFGIELERIDVVVHPQSIVHSMVEFVDGSIIAQLGIPDMRTPIQYALTYPKRMSAPVGYLDLLEVRNLTFEPVDKEAFPCLGYAYEAARRGGSMPAVMSAADEVAVAAFIEGKIKFTDIPKIIKRVMDAHEPIPSPSFAELLEADRWGRETAEKMIEEG